MFKNYYGITPEECRKHNIPVTIFERANPKVPIFNYSKPDFLSYPEIIELQEFTIVGIASKGTFEGNLQNNNIPKAWNKFHIRKREIHNAAIPFWAVGVAYESDFQNSFNYLIGLKVNSSDEIPKGMIKKEIPASKYAVFTYQGIVEVERFYKALDYIWGNWLLNSNFQHNNIVDLIEVITEECTGRDDNRYDIIVPIK